MAERDVSDSALPSDLEGVIERFEDAWQRGQRPAIEDHLTGNDGNRRALLVELVHVDLERRLRIGDAARIEHYLRRFPELAADRGQMLDLLAAEYRLRRKREPDLTPEAVVAGVPEYAADLRAALGLPAAPPSAFDCLLERLRRGDGPAWERFLSLYTPLLDSWLRRLGIPDSEGAILLTEIGQEVRRRMSEFGSGPRHSFRRWLRTLVLTKWSEHRRRHGPGNPVTAVEGRLFSEEEYRGSLLAEGLRLLQNEFEPKDWQACWEQVIRDRPAAEVAVELSLEPDVVLAARARGFERLRQELAGLLD